MTRSFSFELQGTDLANCLGVCCLQYRSNQRFPPRQFAREPPWRLGSQLSLAGCEAKAIRNAPFFLGKVDVKGGIEHALLGGL